MIGTRQVTLSIFGQLDYADPSLIDAFGRVRPRAARASCIHVVGKHSATGAFVQSNILLYWPTDSEFEASAEPEHGHTGRFIWYDHTIDRARILPVAWRDCRAIAREWSALPLIVLAGLR